MTREICDLEEMVMERYERPIKLKTNKIPYLIPGGGLIERFLGEEEALGGSAGDSSAENGSRINNG